MEIGAERLVDDEAEVAMRPRDDGVERRLLVAPGVDADRFFKHRLWPCSRAGRGTLILGAERASRRGSPPGRRACVGGLHNLWPAARSLPEKSLALPGPRRRGFPRSHGPPEERVNARMVNQRLMSPSWRQPPRSVREQSAGLVSVPRNRLEWGYPLKRAPLLCVISGPQR